MSVRSMINCTDRRGEVDACVLSVRCTVNGAATAEALPPSPAAKVPMERPVVTQFVATRSCSERRAAHKSKLEDTVVGEAIWDFETLEGSASFVLRTSAVLEWRLPLYKRQ